MTVYHSTQSITEPPAADTANPEPYNCGTLDVESEVVVFPPNPSERAGK